MGLSRSDLDRDRKKVAYTHIHDDGDETVVNIVFTPSKLTAKMADDLGERHGTNEHHAVCETLSLVLVDWDVFEDDEEKVKAAFTYDALLGWPLHFLLGIFMAAQQVNKPGGGAPSGDG
jgi:hypothetical protein